jgi:NTE family protein
VERERETKRVAIACQGGGSHSAFTAGVLTRLLAEKLERYEIVALSGTSGGAICALLGLVRALEGRPGGGRKAA